jgi:acetyl-CoA C-acetyltransferase
MCAEKCSKDYGISREEQDAYAIESYTRAQKAIKSGLFADEIERVEVPQRRGTPIVIDTDEEPSSAKLEKFSSLRPAFTKDNGTVTAANSSSLNDGAAAMVLMSEESALELDLQPLARVLGYGDAAQDPIDFTTSPSLAVPIAARNAGIEVSDIDYHEINEAFSVVVS